MFCPRHLWLKIKLCTGIGWLPVLFALSAAASPLDYRTFRQGQSVWIVSRSDILVYNLDSRGLRPVILDQNVANDSIVDAVALDGVLAVSARSGLYQVDLSTATVERLPGRPDSVSLGRVAMDQDYLWFAPRGDTLWQFDRLGREWLGYALRGVPTGQPPIGLSVNGGEVVVLRPDGAAVFQPSEEKWYHFPLSGQPLSAGSRVLNAGTALVVPQGNRICRYLSDKRTWDVVDCAAPLLDITSQDTLLYCLTVSGVSAYSMGSGTLTPLEIPGLQQPTALCRGTDALYVATSRSVVTYSVSAGTSDAIAHPSQSAAPVANLALVADSVLVVLYPDCIGRCAIKTATWETTPLASVRRSSRRLRWDSEGLRLNYGGGAYSLLRGQVSQELTLRTMGWHYDTTYPAAMAVDSILLMGVGTPPPEGNLTLHTQFAGGRYLDAFFDNTQLDRIPRKGVRYKGGDDDRLAEARAGSVTLAVPQSAVFPAVDLEGGEVQMQSHAKLQGRDRHVLRGEAEGGVLVTQTRTEILAYRPDRSYTLSAFRRSGSIADSSGADSLTQGARADTVQIVPGSVILTVDGERLDSTLYLFVPGSGQIKFDRDDIVDPTSVIMVSYRVRTLPLAGVRDVEFVPGRDFGQVARAQAQVSPLDWLSLRTGYTYLYRDRRHDLADAALPLEWRNDRFMLKLNPEFAIDASDSAHAKAGALGLASRIGQHTSLSFNGLLADSGFASTDILSRGYGDRTAELDYTLAYDITRDIQVKYYQYNRQATAGSEDRYELSGSVRMPRLPYLDVSLSRSRTNAVFGSVADSAARDSTDSAGVRADTMDNLKDKLRVRLYELSSAGLQRLLHVNKLGYEFSYTEFRAKTNGGDSTRSGRALYGNLTLMPLSSVTVTAGATYQANPQGVAVGRQIWPRLSLQTTGFPRGVDLNARYDVNLGRMQASDSSSVQLQRSARLTLKPGSWWDALRWLTVWGEATQNLNCWYGTRDPALSDVLLGSADSASAVLSYKGGLSLYPSSAVLFQSSSGWTQSPGGRSVTSRNDLKLWLGQRALWQTLYLFDWREADSRTHQGSTVYDKTWNNWLRTRQGVSVTYKQTSTAHTVKLGPQLDVDVTARDAWILTALLWRNSLGADWNRLSNGVYPDGKVDWGPDFYYSLYLRAAIKPDIVVETEQRLQLTRWSFDATSGYRGSFKLTVLF